MAYILGRAAKDFWGFEALKTLTLVFIEPQIFFKVNCENKMTILQTYFSFVIGLLYGLKKKKTFIF